jgi:transposase-like protein
MNNPHQNARTTRLGRAEMIRHIIEDGQPTREVARGFGISARTARKWLARYRTKGRADWTIAPLARERSQTARPSTGLA